VARTEGAAVPGAAEKVSVYPLEDAFIDVGGQKVGNGARKHVNRGWVRAIDEPLALLIVALEDLPPADFDETVTLLPGPRLMVTVMGCAAPRFFPVTRATARIVSPGWALTDPASGSCVGAEEPLDLGMSLTSSEVE
jgi:hypothetical protein